MDAVASIQDDVHQCRHVGHVDVAVVVDVGIPDDEIFVVYAEDMVHQTHYIAIVNISVTIHVTKVRVYLEIGTEGVDGHRGIGPVEHIGGTEVELLVVGGSNIRGIISADEGHGATIRLDANGGDGIDSRRGCSL